MRRGWDFTWMSVADAMAKRSRCAGRQIGAVLVSADNAQCFVGYNGPPAGWTPPADGDCSAWCPRMQRRERSLDYSNCITIHAEANALIHANHSRIAGGTIYVTAACCWECGKLVANCGISRVVMRVGLDDTHRQPELTINMLRESGLEVDIFNG